MELISVEEVQRRTLAGEQLNLLDVREPDERQQFNIGGRFLPVGSILSMQTEEIEDWKDSEVICYCRSGQRSMRAALFLESMGFTNVKNLSGGILEWQEKVKS